jgi:peptide/nickel transport system substrate-binding protein
VIHTVDADVRAEVLTGTRDLDLSEGTATVASIKRVREAGGVADLSFGELAYATINPDVGHLEDLNCRRAVAYAVDHAAVQESYSINDEHIGLATTILPPGIPGRSAQFDAFGVRSRPDGDLDQARRALDACGRPGGFRFTIAYEGRDRKAANAISTALKRVGITASLLHEDARNGAGLETGKCSSPNWRKLNHVGMCLYAWSPDWQDGYGMLEPLVDSNARSAEGTSYNFSVDRDEVDGLINQALSSPTPRDRDTLWAQVDAYVVGQALILPLAYVARLLVRPPGLTNLWVNPSYGTYDYAAVGVVDGGKS